MPVVAGPEPRGHPYCGKCMECGKIVYSAIVCTEYVCWTCAGRKLDSMHV